MKIRFTLVLLIILCFSMNGQKKDLDKNVYMYKTIEDFNSQKGEFVGELSWFEWYGWGSSQLFLKNNDVETKLNLNKYWGFKIGDYLFRMNNNSPKMPLCVVNTNEKVFYINGFFYLSIIRYGIPGSSDRSENAVFYSDTIDSEIYAITKIINNEKDNPKLQELIECIKKGKKRYGAQSQFNAFSECLK